MAPLPLKVLMQGIAPLQTFGYKLISGSDLLMLLCLADSETALYTELWHACAGPLVTVPRERELVYYFPQGHIEQVFVRVSSSCHFILLFVVTIVSYDTTVEFLSFACLNTFNLIFFEIIVVLLSDLVKVRIIAIVDTVC